MISGDRYENGLNSKTNTTLHVRVQHNINIFAVVLHDYNGKLPKTS